MELVSTRRDVALVMAEHGLGERYACKCGFRANVNAVPGSR
jgi:hypothetical protein